MSIITDKTYDSYGPEWKDYKNRTDYKEFRIRLEETDSRRAAFLVMDEGTKLCITGNLISDSLALSFEHNGSFSPFYTLSGDLLENMKEISPRVIFVSKVSKTPGNIWADIRCYRF